MRCRSLAPASGAYPFFSSFSRWFIRQTIRNFSWIFLWCFLLPFRQRNLISRLFTSMWIFYQFYLTVAWVSVCVCERSYTRAHFYTINDDNDFHFWRIFALTWCSACVERLRSYVMWCDKNGTPRGISRNALGASGSGCAWRWESFGRSLSFNFINKILFCVCHALHSAFDLKRFNNSRQTA